MKPQRRAFALCCALVIGWECVACAQEIDRELVRRGKAEAEILWRRGFTLGDEPLDSLLQAMLDSLVSSRAVNPALDLKVRIFRSPDINAFALPDGSIFVFAGLLASMNTWDQVAFVLAHEAVHPIGLHAQKNISQAKGKLAALKVLSVGAAVAFSASSFSGAGLVSALTQLGLGLAASASISGYGRDLEREADTEGCVMQIEAGYDPCAGAQALHILLMKEGDQSRLANVFWGNHPRLEERIETINARAPEICISDSVGVKEDYAALRARMQRLTADLWLAAYQYEEAADVARARLLDCPEDAEMHYVLGEAYAVSKSQDTVQLAVDEFKAALALGGEEFRLPIEGLARVALERGDTVAAVSYLRRYLAAGSYVPNRRAVQRRLDFLRTRIVEITPAGGDTSRVLMTDSLKASPADTSMKEEKR